MSPAHRLVDRLLSRGLLLWIEGREICFSPAELLTAEDLRQLREQRELVFETLPHRLPDQGVERLTATERAALEGTPELIDLAGLPMLMRETVSFLALAYLRDGLRPDLARRLAFALILDRPTH